MQNWREVEINNTLDIFEVLVVLDGEIMWGFFMANFWVILASLSGISLILLIESILTAVYSK